MGSVRFKSPDLERLGKNLERVSQKHGEFLRRNLEKLGKRVAYTMRQEIREHRFTGELSDSIVSSVVGARMTVGPTAKSGGYDRGLILQRGTRAIPNAPFGPISRWAARRGIPAGPVWMKIKRSGVKAHPFLEETLARGDTQVALRNTARRIGLDLVGYAFEHVGQRKSVGAQFLGEAE